ncbi:MAG: hypothetical protein ACYDHH_31010 [Solirubrobacteraceae bacterium]
MSRSTSRGDTDSFASTTNVAVEFDPFKLMIGSMVVGTGPFGPTTFHADRSAAQPRGRDAFSKETAASTSSVSSVAEFADIANRGYLAHVSYFKLFAVRPNSSHQAT